MNPQVNQEYLILTVKKTVSGLTESDRAASQTCDPSAQIVFCLGGTEHAVNCVYTRVMETESAFAGKTVGTGILYLGTTVAVQDIALKVQQVFVTTRGSRIMVGYLSLEQDDLGA